MERNAVSHSTTPTSARSPRRLVDRIFRRRIDSRITSYFPVRKRYLEDFSGVHGKRMRRGVMISDVGFASPNTTCNGTTPLHFRNLSIEEEEPEYAVNLRSASTDSGLSVRALTALGTFEELPHTLFFPLFDSLDASCLSSFCMTSSAWTSYLLNYIRSNSFLQRVQRESKAFSVSEGGCKKNFFTRQDPFYLYGILLKSVSVCLSTARRVAILMSFCQNAVEYGIDRFGVGRVIHTMCSKWAFSECAKVFESLLNINKGRLRNILKKLEKSSPGSLPLIEMEFRKAALPLLLSGIDAKYEGSEVEYAFWLSEVMRCCTRCPAVQSKLLMILFGPTTTDSGQTLIDWRLFCDRTITTQNHAEELLKPLSEALHVLMMTKQLDIHQPWSQHDVFNVIEELTTTPEPWSFENFVSLLLFRPALIPVSLTARMQHNYTDEACLMFNAFATMSQRWNMDVCQIIRQPIMQTMATLAREHGRIFYNHICETYAQQLKQLSQRGQDAAEDLSILMASHAAVTPLLQLMSQSLW
ncbi:hypothetical protein RB195_019589 [Necator americanus]|uniref:FBXO47 ARM repeats region domain-containing protein n=1 Tax=Necator americanus TaxID=51031 RepID=A0ABR1CEW3_NECAM